MKTAIKIFIFFLLFSAGISYTAEPRNRGGTISRQEQIGVEDEIIPEEYFSLVSRVKEFDREVDFKRLRLAYTRTPLYQPYREDEGKEKMNEYFREGNFTKALEYAGRVLENNYTDLDTHFICASIYRQLGNEEKMEFHGGFVFTGLLRSVLESGDGKIRDTAFKVINIREAYTLLGFMGLRRLEQGLLRDNGKYYDRFRVLDPETGEQSTIFFNITIPYTHLLENLP